MTKICSKCKLNKDSDNDFFFKNKGTGRLHAQCKSCYTEKRKETYTQHYRKNSAAYKRRALGRNRRVRSENYERLIAFLTTHPCITCTEADIVVLDFHHRSKDHKTSEVTKMVHMAYSWETIQQEIDKCDILCANCHRRVTARQRNTKRYRFNLT